MTSLLSLPCVTIITVSYNAKDGIEKTILSVVKQSYKNIEYIIVDGGSSDGTIDIIKKYDKQLTCWISEPDKGIYDAMNKGIKKATGEWLIMMNAGDCFANESVLEEVFSRKIPNNISFLYSDVYSKKKDGGLILRPSDFASGNLIHQAIIYKRDLHKEHGYYIVTKKIIISDALFFARIPIDQTMKIDTVLSIYEGGGVSQQGNWAEQQFYCMEVVFRKKSFWGMVFSYSWKRIKSILPVSVKDKIKSVLGINYKG
ncbi:Glycosyltransferase involved in cell wall bisynthesis [Prevotella sp. ne3005]|uniref:glycosyltransferase family 2 protein n=1 Tax=Prevotella sp. ne3005 TaxID=1761887 RepID=UPI0008D5BFCB|nr:glycosyltransferase family 2 protein [Prevotella sp. ne3005]SEM53720.1 Glycosyltransferase involved in cell wall bisynthesis [Prevotella sp. ne3005]